MQSLRFMTEILYGPVIFDEIIAELDLFFHRPLRLQSLQNLRAAQVVAFMNTIDKLFPGGIDGYGDIRMMVQTELKKKRSIDNQIERS